MNNDLASAMRRAAELVRAGDPAAATQLIQSTLAGSSSAGETPPERSSKPQKPHATARASKPTRGLGATLADLAARMPAQGVRTDDLSDPSLPAGAQFTAGTFSCAAGSRDYRVYAPDLQSAAPTGLVMMLHGCTQSPVDFANGTGMNRLADAHGFIVVYPGQSRGANMQSCWNWFGPADQSRHAGEPAILAGLAAELQNAHAIDRKNVFVAGLSAGAAMAVILGHTHPDVFSAVGAHSGLPYKAAHDMPSAFAAMGGAAPARAQVAENPIPTIVFHGSADTTVNAANGQRIADAALPPSASEIVDSGQQNGRAFTRRTALCCDGFSAVEHWSIEGLGHAWSGGNPSGSYTDATGPDASAEMIRFFLDIPLKGA